MLLFAAATLGADWGQFRGPDGNGVSAETNLPTKWSATENVRWKAELPGRGVAGAVVAGGRVYVTASSGPKQDRLHVLCFDAASGKKRWERQFWATGNTQSHPKTAMAAPTPATDGKRVFALFATGDLFAFDPDGNLLWYRALVPDYPTITNQVGMAASPVLWKDVLIVPMENVGESFVAGLDVTTGENRWKVARVRDINWTTPYIITRPDRAEVLIQSMLDLSAFDPATGKKVWSYKAKDLSTIPSPVAANGLVLSPGSELAALRVDKDKPEPSVAWKSNKLRIGSYSTPLVYKDRVYVVGGVGLNCGDVADGKVIWQQRLKGPFAASPVAGDGKIYVVNEEGTTFVLEPSEPEPKLLATNALGESVLGTPAIADGAIYLRTEKTLFCIGEKAK